MRAGYSRVEEGAGGKLSVLITLLLSQIRRSHSCQPPATELDVGAGSVQITADTDKPEKNLQKWILFLLTLQGFFFFFTEYLLRLK